SEEKEDEEEDKDDSEEKEDEEEDKDDSEEREDEYTAKGEFVETDGKQVVLTFQKKQCDSHVACYDQREPQAWCILKRNQSWTNKGCFCDEKRHLCVMERMNGGKLEYAYCAPAKNWKCSYD
ncbi:unnamed protein product, partial [Brugia timori]|uniref:Larval allergen n=1 Tax=Brugia timori TaxID=42155 RepID=A0A0R3RB58_9BILA